MKSIVGIMLLINILREAQKQGVWIDHKYYYSLKHILKLMKR